MVNTLLSVWAWGRTWRRAAAVAGAGLGRGHPPQRGVLAEPQGRRQRPTPVAVVHLPTTSAPWMGAARAGGRPMAGPGPRGTHLVHLPARSPQEEVRMVELPCRLPRQVGQGEPVLALEAVFRRGRRSAVALNRRAPRRGGAGAVDAYSAPLSWAPTNIISARDGEQNEGGANKGWK